MKSILKRLAVAAAVVAVSSAAYAENMRIILVSHGQAADPFHSIVKNGFYQAGKDLGIDVDYRAPETFDMVQMGQLIDAAVNQKPDGLIVTNPDADALGPAIQRAVAAGIPVVSINSGQDVAAKLGAIAFVGQDEGLSGKLAGERLKASGGTKALCINVEPGNVTIDLRCSSFEEGFANPVTTLPTTMDPADVQAKVKAALEADPDIDTILSTSANVAGEPALRAIAELQLEGKVHFATFDLSAAVLQAVEQGKVEFAIDQQQYMYGYMPVAILKLYAHSGIVPASDVLTGPRFVTKDMASQVIDLASKGIR